MPRYAETKPAADEERLARLTNEICSARMEIEPPELVFVSESIIGEIVWNGQIAGLTRKGKIYVVAGQSPRELIRTAAHEAKARSAVATGQIHKSGMARA